MWIPVKKKQLEDTTCECNFSLNNVLLNNQKLSDLAKVALLNVFLIAVEKHVTAVNIITIHDGES